jgi:putative component of toxin-antitoxin plasmid stabilization module
VKFTLVELEELTGEKLKVYSLFIDDEELTCFDRFIEENTDSYEQELIDITNRIEVMAKYTGIREDFVKTGEGNPGDGIHALYDKPDSKLRLYFIRFGNIAIVLGGGGPKPKSIRRLQEDPKLKNENYLLRNVSKALTDAVENGLLFVTDEGLESITDFEFTTDEDE